MKGYQVKTRNHEECKRLLAFLKSLGFDKINVAAEMIKDYFPICLVSENGYVNGYRGFYGLETRLSCVEEFPILAIVNWSNAWTSSTTR